MSYLPRQAVIIVHGIGEQTPLATLRSFVAGVAGDHPTFAAPDRITRRSYARRYDTRWNQSSAEGEVDAAVGSGRTMKMDAQTDFYELYWAYRFRDTTWGDIGGWIRRLFLRPRRKLTTTRLAGPARVAWVPLLMLAIALGLLLAAVVRQRNWADLWSDWPLLIAAAVFLVGSVVVADRMSALVLARTVGGLVAVLAVSALVLTVYVKRDWWAVGLFIVGAFGVAAAVMAYVGALVASFALGGVGDAARYLSPNPRNIVEIDEIRSQAVELLRRLHELGDAHSGSYYERIVVVGHSLGSVVAFDALRLYWTDVNRQLRFLKPMDPAGWQQTFVREEREERVREVETAADTLRLAVLDPSLAGAALGGYQRAYWRAQRSLMQTLTAPGPDDGLAERDGLAIPPRWLVTDFVSVGSPLAHAELLMAENADDFYRQQTDRTWPTCPPQPQATKNWRSLRFRLSAKPDRVVTALHQATPFAATHWTNIYDDRDQVGGPVAPVFGAGVRDVKLSHTTGSLIVDSLHVPHTRYWTPGKGKALPELQGLIGRRPRVLIFIKKPSAECQQAVMEAIGDEPTATSAPFFEVEVRYLRYAVVADDVGDAANELGEYRRLALGGLGRCDLDGLKRLIELRDGDPKAWELRIAVSGDATQPADVAEEVGA
jgi:hypothetical protein